MRVIYLHQDIYSVLTGADRMVVRVAELMQERGHEVQIVCHGMSKRPTWSEKHGLETLEIPIENLDQLHTLLPSRPDIVHVVDVTDVDFTLAGAKLAQALGVPLGVTPASSVSVWNDVDSVYEICRSADALFVLNQVEKDLFYKHGVPYERMAMISQGPELDGIPDPAAFRKRYNISGPIVLFLGRKARFKGYVTLLAATELVWNHRPDTCFAFLGPHWDENCKSIFQAYSDPRIIETRLVNEQEKYSALEACDMLCLPTSADVFPLVFVEAWSCKKPVITAPFPGASEVVRDNHDGLIVEATPPAVASSVLKLLEDEELRMSLGKNGRKRVDSELNWTKVTDQIEAAYKHLISV